MHENVLKNELALKCNAPIGTERDVKVCFTIDFELNAKYFYHDDLFFNELDETRSQC